MTTLIFVRHGQSLANAQEKFAGHSDFDLSPIGRAQAERAAEYIAANYKIDKIYSSDLLRAYNTALPIGKKLGLQVETTKDFREISAGLWEGLTFDEIAQRFPEEYAVWSKDFSRAECPGGESASDVYVRVNAAVDKIAAKHPDSTLLIGAHATVIRACECRARGYGKDQMGKVAFSHNASINIFKWQDGTLLPERSNITEHLGELDTAVPQKINA